MDTLTRMRAFIDVVEAEGFSAAARKIGRSKALLSKYVRELEDELGALLLNRTTRQFSLTEAGHTYYKRASEIIREIDHLSDSVRDTASDVRGRIKLSASRTFADAEIGQSLIGQLSNVAPRAFEDAPEARVGAILNVTPAQTRDAVLAGLGEEDAEFAERVRRTIFTFADIAKRIEGRDIPKVTRGIDQAQLVTALAAATEGDDATSAEFILSNLSQRMAATLREEMEARGTVKVKDADAAQTALIAAIRDLEATGELVLRQDEAEEEDG